MDMREKLISVGERIDWPDAFTRAGIGWLVSRTDRELAASPKLVPDFALDMQRYPVALNTVEANKQHYEVPAAFFRAILGPRLKYSCCLFDGQADTLAAAEERALAASCAYADLADGQEILELGCGWGSLSLWMAEHYPKARILSVSNSHSQRDFILQRAAERQLPNLSVVTADMNVFATERSFDRIVSIEMFEHMANWSALLARAARWLKSEGRLYVHVFSHKDAPYRFEQTDRSDWIAQHFFTGGIMPSHDLMHQFTETFTVEQEWRWSGEHYQRTAQCWLANFDARRDEIDRVLSTVYGADAALWRRRWRLFLMATMGLFGHASGNVWGVSHYRLAPSEIRR
jgi:cyclopropane-fatty-acyl-phospholipid synthase